MMISGDTKADYGRVIEVMVLLRDLFIATLEQFQMLMQTWNLKQNRHILQDLFTTTMQML